MRRTPLYDNFGEQDDLDDASNVRPITTMPAPARPTPRGDVRYVRNSRRPPPRRGSRWRTWIISGALGVAILSGVWLGLMLAFPPFERSSVQPAPTAPAEPTQAIVPNAGPAATAIAAAPTPAQSQPTQATGPERLPGIATVAPPAASAGVQVAPKPAEEQATAEAAPAQEQAVARPADAAPPSGQPTEKPSDGQATDQQASAPTEAPADAQPGPGTPAPIPPPEDAASKPEAPAPRAAAPPPAARQQPAAKPAPKPAVAAPPPPASGGAFALSASVSPANPVSENAVVTVSVRATSNGAPVAGASCLATIYYRTATARQPSGGFRTGANGVGSFTLDAKGATYGHAIPIDVTCSGRGGSAAARTSFTPVRGR